VFERDGKLWTTSLDVARVFEKEHRNVLQSTENLECSEEFRRLNFQQSSYVNEQNRTMPMFEMTQDGFTFLAMGFTGKKAAQFKGRSASFSLSNFGEIEEGIIESGIEAGLLYPWCC
jgi:Rha family phage regulatory protein